MMPRTNENTATTSITNTESDDTTTAEAAAAETTEDTTFAAAESPLQQNNEGDGNDIQGTEDAKEEAAVVAAADESETIRKSESESSRSSSASSSSRRGDEERLSSSPSPQTALPHQPHRQQQHDPAESETLTFYPHQQHHHHHSGLHSQLLQTAQQIHEQQGYRSPHNSSVQYSFVDGVTGNGMSLAAALPQQQQTQMQHQIQMLQGRQQLYGSSSPIHHLQQQQQQAQLQHQQGSVALQFPYSAADLTSPSTLGRPYNQGLTGMSGYSSMMPVVAASPTAPAADPVTSAVGGVGIVGVGGDRYEEAAAALAAAHSSSPQQQRLMGIPTATGNPAADREEDLLLNLLIARRQRGRIGLTDSSTGSSSTPGSAHVLQPSLSDELYRVRQQHQQQQQMRQHQFQQQQQQLQQQQRGGSLLHSSLSQVSGLPASSEGMMSSGAVSGAMMHLQQQQQEQSDLAPQHPQHFSMHQYAHGYAYPSLQGIMQHERMDRNPGLGLSMSMDARTSSDLLDVGGGVGGVNSGGGVGVIGTIEMKRGYPFALPSHTTSSSFGGAMGPSHPVMMMGVDAGAGGESGGQEVDVGELDVGMEDVEAAKKKRKHKKKPADMPRRPLSAYNLFFSEEREVILKEMGVNDVTDLKDEAYEQETARKDDDTLAVVSKKPKALMRPLIPSVKKRRPHRKTHGKISFQKLARMVGERWKSLPDERRQYYQNLAKEDMTRQKAAMEEYYIRQNSFKNAKDDKQHRNDNNDEEDLKSEVEELERVERDNGAVDVNSSDASSSITDANTRAIEA